MKKTTWKILLLVVMTMLLVGLTVTALAAPEDENNAFLFERKGTLSGTAPNSGRNVPLLTDAYTMTVRVNNNHTGTNGAEVRIDELRFRTWSDIPGATVEKELNAATGKSSAVYSLTNVPKDTYTVYVKAYENTANVPFYIGVSGSYKIALEAKKGNLVVGQTYSPKVYYAKDLTKTWTSNNTNICTVDADGKVTAKGIGTCIITCSAGGQTASMTITVYGLNMSNRVLGFKEKVTIAVPNPEDNIQSVSWSIDDSTIATVTAKENFTAEVVAKEKEGTATVTAEVLPKGSSIKKKVTCKITVAKDKEAASSTGATGTMVIETGNWGKLHLRAEKNRKSQSLGLYPSGTVVKVTANDGTWARVTVGGKSGYMMSRYLKAYSGSESGEGGGGGGGGGTPNLPIDSYVVAPGTKLHVKGSSFIYLRSSTSTADNSNVIAKMPGGSEVTMVKWGKWYSQVQYGSKVGYVVTSHLRK